MIKYSVEVKLARKLGKTLSTVLCSEKAGFAELGVSWVFSVLTNFSLVNLQPLQMFQFGIFI